MPQIIAPTESIHPLPQVVPTEAVALLWDEDKKAIGVKAADSRRRNAFPLKKKDRWENRVAHARPFCKHFGIAVSRTLVFNEVDVDTTGVMRLELEKTTAVGRY